MLVVFPGLQHTIQEISLVSRHMDPKEASINYFMHGSKDEHCTLHCNVKSQVDKIIKRNPNYISVQESGGEWMVTYPRNEVRPPYMWVKVPSQTEEEDEVESEEA